MALYKDYAIVLDTKRTPRISLQNIVVGETGNRLYINLKNDGTTVSLASATHRVCLRVDSALGTRRQDSAVADNGVTFSSGKAVILLSKDAYTGGLNRCCLEVYTTDTDTDDTLICSAEFQFVAKGEALGDNTGVAAPLLVQYEQQAKSWARGGTGVREGEDTDNAKYYKDLAEQAVQGGIVDPTIDAWLDDHSSHIDGVITDGVDEWLGEHPEATTTVQDGAVTLAKLADAVKSHFALADDVDGLKSQIDSVRNATAEEVGIKLGEYVDSSLIFLQGGINPSTGDFTPGRANRTTTDFIKIPSGASLVSTVTTGYVKSNFVWFDASKSYVGQGNPKPANAAYTRFSVQKSDNTNITPAEAAGVSKLTITQPYSVSGLVSQISELDGIVDKIESMYDVYNDYVVEKENITSKVTNGAFGYGYNNASYSNGTLTIPANSSGATSYIGVRITSGFALLKNNVARVKIAFDDLSGIKLEQKILKSPNTDWVHVIDFNIDLQTNVVEVTFLIDSDSATYVFFGVQVSYTATAQTSQKTITYNGATIYSSELYDIPVKRALKMQLFGDSITDDVRVVSGSETIITTWASKIAEYMTGYNLTIVNSAVGGSGIGHGKSSTARYSTKEYNYVHDLVTDGTLVTDSDVITLLIGTNNWRGEGGGSFGTLGQLGDNTVSTFYGAANLVCKYIAEHSNALLVIITPPQRYNSADQESQTTALGEVLNSSEHTLKDYCKALKEVAALYGYPVVDLNDDLGWNKYNVANFTSDGLHPSALKCYRLTEVICGAIKAYLGD